MRVLLAAMEQKLEAAASEAEALDKEANRKLPGAGKLKSAIAERERKMAALQTRIHEIEDNIFAAFSKKARTPLPVVLWRSYHTSPAPLSCYQLGEWASVQLWQAAVCSQWCCSALACRHMFCWFLSTGIERASHLQLCS